jgi:hypothetical protein
MSSKVPSVQTLVVIAVFALLYMRFLVKKTLRERLDLYDLLLLSLIALVPAFFAFFPYASDLITEFTGVAFPFVIMFGILFAVVFILVHRLAVRIHHLETLNRSVIQELALLDRKKAGKRSGSSNELTV